MFSPNAPDSDFGGSGVANNVLERDDGFKPPEERRERSESLAARGEMNAVPSFDLLWNSDWRERR